MNIISRIVDSLVNFYDGDLKKLSDLIVGKSDISKSAMTEIITIVDRSFYTEIEKKYPLDKSSELRKLLKLEYFSKDYSYAIGKSLEGSTSVTIWEFDDNTPNAFVRVPESVILAKLLTENNALVIQKDRPLYILKSSSGVLSCSRTHLIDSVEKFAIAAGIKLESTQVIPETEYFRLIKENIPRLKLSELVHFINWKALYKLKPMFFKMVSPFVLVAAVYFTATTLFLWGKNEYLKSQYLEQKDLVNGILDTQTNIQNKTERYEILSSLISKQEFSTRVWSVIDIMITNGKVRNIRKVQDKFVVRGATKSATSLLEKVNAHFYIEEATFESPTRTVRGEESYIIGFKLRHEKGVLRDKESELGTVEAEI